jgi:hypothetical protein
MTFNRMAAMAALAMGAAHIDGLDMCDLPIWSPRKKMHATRPPRKRSTHKQNARKARKGRK